MRHSLPQMRTITLNTGHIPSQMHSSNEKKHRQQWKLSKGSLRPARRPRHFVCSIQLIVLFMTEGNTYNKSARTVRALLLFVL